MEMKQILSESSEFKGYQVITKLSTHHDGEREVYQIWYDGWQVAVLTLFDIRCERYAFDSVSKNEILNSIAEIRFLRENKDLEGIAEVLDYGVDAYDGHVYAWIVQEYLEDPSIQSIIELNEVIKGKDCAAIGKKVGAIIEKIVTFTEGGGHYNISPEHILVSIEDDELTSVHLIGFSNIGQSYSGKTPIEIKCLDKRFRAPEASKGIFNIKSDIYSLGMVLLVAATGYPEIIESGESCYNLEDAEINMEKIPAVDIHNAMWKKRDGSLSRAFRTILKKATSIYPAERFNSMAKFMYFIAKCYRRHEQQGVESEANKEENLNKKEVPGDMTAHDYEPTTQNKGFDSVAGMEELKKLFRRDFISIVKNPQIASAYGIRPSNCTLLYGPQGCGKTYIAEKAAQESGLKYKIVKPSDLGSIYIHGAQGKIAETFDEAQKEGPIILIFDEFDALVPKRNADINDSQATEVNEILTQLNNCSERGIYCLCTTNRPDKIDPAVMRKGRIDRSIYVSLPDFEARKELFRLTLEGRPVDETIDFEQLATVTEKYTCSDITYIVDETARVCFEETLDNKLSDPIKMTQEMLLQVAKDTIPSVSDEQLKEFLEMKAKMENKQIEVNRKRVGFAV